MTEREQLDMVQSLRREHAITREELERAQQALRDVVNRCTEYSALSTWLDEIVAIAKRGLEP